MAKTSTGAFAFPVCCNSVKRKLINGRVLIDSSFQSQLIACLIEEVSSFNRSKQLLKGVNRGC
jgi:hypothetical protein